MSAPAGSTPYGVRDLVVEHAHGRALDGVSLDVPAGQVTAVVGGDGAGKSTLLGVLTGRVVPDAGTVHAPGRRDLGSMPATSGVWPDLTVAENLDLVAAAHHLPAAVAAERTAELLAVAGLTDARGRLGRQLSGGMRQKLGFCMALLHRPSLVVLDEPSTGVDPVSRVELWRLVTRTAADGAAVLVSTTYLDEAERVADVLVLDRGRVVHHGDPRRAADHLRGTVVDLGPAAAGRALPDLPTWRRGPHRHALLPAGAAPGQAVVLDPPDLEDAVVALTLEGDDDARSDLAAVAVPGDSTRTPHGEPVVRVVDVVTSFGDLRAVDGVALEVRPARVVGLLGANGAGKTTLIRTVLGLVAPDSGQVEVLGGPPSRRSRARLGYVPQGLGLSAQLSVRENLEFVASVHGVPAPPLPPALDAVRDRPVDGIGLGLQRRLVFLAALVHHPDLLVLDEPTSGLGPVGRAGLWETVRAQAEQGVGVLVTTHVMAEAEQCDELVLMHAGRVVASGTAADLVRGTRAVEVRATAWQDAFAALTQAGLPVTVSGRSVRVAGHEPDAVRAALARAALTAHVTEVPAGLEEVMALTRA